MGDYEQTYFVLKPDGTVGKRHKDYKKATAEAEALARKFPGERIEVLQTHRFAMFGGMSWTHYNPF
jgi:hypothetical protein